jgi:hypothetical protein
MEENNVVELASRDTISMSTSAERNVFWLLKMVRVKVRRAGVRFR